MRKNRISISNIQIKNFRSIKNLNLRTDDLNIIVGLNDVGKSNLIKALNLFFTGETESGCKYNFSRDFSYLFNKKSGKAQEIFISLQFDVPEYYSNHGTYTWEKRWRSDGINKDVITGPNGKETTARSKVPGTLRRIQFRYVPAVKSQEFYKELMRQLYISMSRNLRNPLNKSTLDFSVALKENTLLLSKEIESRLGFKSVLSVPQDLTEIFSALVFQTQKSDEDVDVPLSLRGDGIQVGHIPIILKYLSDEANAYNTKGSSRIYTIWGFEEPENGLEMARTIELAKDFVNYSSQIQMFVTTHSPAFYMKKGEENCEVIYALKENDGEGTKFKKEIDRMKLHKDMGIMPLLAPIIEEKVKEIEAAHEMSINGVLVDKDTILVEGPTDKIYLECAIQAFSEKLTRRMQEGKLIIFCKDNEAGCTKVSDFAISWSYSSNRSRLVALFDRDVAGEAAYEVLRKKLNENPRRNDVVQEYLIPSDSISKLFRVGAKPIFEIEHLLSSSFWDLLVNKNWLVEKKSSELIGSFSAIADVNIPLKDSIQEKVDEVGGDARKFLMDPKPDKKMQICMMAERMFKEEKNTEIFGDLIYTISKLERLFRV